MSIPLDQIDVGERLRAVDNDYVALIAESLAERGLDTPIIVSGPGANGRHTLIAGGHRVAAARLAGWSEIPAKVVEVDELQAKLIEIDENLIRRELSALDRAVFLAERKRIYEALNPETAHGKAKKNKGLEKWTSLSTFAERFSKATATKLGVDERTIRRAVARAAIIPEVRALIASHPIADSGAELDQLAGQTPERQREIAERLVREGATARTVASALVEIVGKPRVSDAVEIDRQYRAIMSAWGKASYVRAQQQFLDVICATRGGRKMAEKALSRSPSDETEAA
nr:ParB N-terminal domain-containing protein [Neoroseomonas eburnea]